MGVEMRKGHAGAGGESGGAGPGSGPADWTLMGLRDTVAGRGASAEEVVRLYLERIDRLDPSLHCFNAVFHERSLTKAKQIDRRLAAGESVGPLAGCPIAIKDNLCTNWGRTTCSSRILENFEAPYTATVVERLENAGAIVVGKTNLDEFAMGSSTENSAFGPSRNPWDPSRVPGGSSGGSAAALAAGLCAASFGSETGGSVRQPAALCGVVGVKPTYGALSRYGLVAFASSLDQIAPFARTAEDAALLMSVAAGNDPKDSTSDPRADRMDFSEIVKPLAGNVRLGLPKQYLSDANDPSVATMFDAAIAVWKRLGATVVDLDLPTTKYGVPVYYVVATAEASSNLARFDGIRYGHRAKIGPDETLEDLYCKSRAEGFGEEVQRRIMLGTYSLSSGYYDAYYNRALKVRRLIKQDFDRAFERCDAILCPTTPSPAFKIGEKADDPLQMYLCDIYTVNVNLAGIAAVSVPGGMAAVDGGKTKLPLGLQFIGPTFSEPRLLQLAHAFERATPWHTMRPPLG